MTVDEGRDPKKGAETKHSVKQGQGRGWGAESFPTEIHGVVGEYPGGRDFGKWGGRETLAAPFAR